MKLPQIPNGVWPVMVTPFTEDNQIDYGALETLIEWYIAQGVHGLFAVCQSSEMFYLTRDERVGLARFVKEKTAGRLPVVASGHISDSIEDQIEELEQMSKTGVEAVVLVSNRMAAQDEDDEVWKRNVQLLLDRIPNVPLGIYECPYPYKRLLSPQLLEWCAGTGRFMFLKDTSCDLEQIREKLRAVEGSPLKIFNANSATLLQSMRLGAAGFSGVMANFHPELYVRLMEQWRSKPELADRIQSFLGVASLVELQYYPVNAKYHLQLSGIPITLSSRVKEAGRFAANQKLEVEQLYSLYRLLEGQLH